MQIDEQQQQQMAVANECCFIYPFPASGLSSRQLLRVLSAWLMPSPSADEEGPSMDVPSSCFSDIDCSFECASISVPMVFSHDEWFVQCVPALGEQLDKLLLLSQHQREAEGDSCFQQRRNTDDDNDEECHVRRVLCHLLALTTRIPMRTQPRAEMGLFIPIAQFLLLCRLFQLLLQRELQLSHEAYEPQLMAWLVDIYRTKCYAKTEEGEEEDSTMAAENGYGTTAKAAVPTVGELFRAQLGHFYAQIDGIKFEDPPSSVNFYASICLLLVGHALHGHRPTLLRLVGPAWLGRVREQLADWRAMDEADKAAQQQKQSHKKPQKRDEHGDDDDEMSAELRRRMTQSVEQQQLFRMNMFAFQLDEAERRVQEALNGSSEE
ncbi:hypothetical protein niasHT_006523 [Heterodera trifolii]|uniref:Uncharacterized protein n=1 Tax=Heterodera trifolii TaxID=157864 RepID=A0ABD2LTX9_9BILA